MKTSTENEDIKTSKLLVKANGSIKQGSSSVFATSRWDNENITTEDDEDQFHSAASTPVLTRKITPQLIRYRPLHENYDREQYPLHKCVFLDNVKELKLLLKQPFEKWISLDDELCRIDKHGNTPLHLAVMLGRKECMQLLLSHNASVKLKNRDGWTPLAEAISYGDRDMITAILKKLREQSRKHLEKRRNCVIRGLEQIPDFYMELKWDFASWVPFASRVLPSDVCKIHKSGALLRLDSTLVDFNDMRWERGNISFIFRGDRPINDSLIVMDNDYECYQHMRYEESDIEDEVDMLMSTDILTANMSTKNIYFSRIQTGWFHREDRKEIIGGQYHCDLYSIHGLVLKQRKRREHLSKDDLQKNKATVDTLTRGHTSLPSTYNGTTGISPSHSLEEIQRRCSLHPPVNTTTWEQYINAEIGKCPQLGRPPMHKQSSKTLRATVAISRDFPINVEMLLNILEVIAPFKHISKLRDFVAVKLPTGFPVKIEIPILHTVTAKITFQKFEYRSNVAKSLFEVPEHYVEDARRFPDL